MKRIKWLKHGYNIELYDEKLGSEFMRELVEDTMTIILTSAKLYDIAITSDFEDLLLQLKTITDKYKFRG